MFIVNQQSGRKLLLYIEIFCLFFMLKINYLL